MDERANSERKNFRYLATGNGVLNSESAILFFKTVGFNRSPTPPFLIPAYSPELAATASGSHDRGFCLTFWFTSLQERE
jgi:hypothetical protein